MTMKAAAKGPQRYADRYRPLPESAAQARRDVTLALNAWGLTSLIPAARQIVTELVTNAVQHSGTQCVGASITRASETTVRIIVTDTSRTLPETRAPGEKEETGRGLLLVAAFATRWGAERLAGGKRCWAELTVPHD